MVEIMDQGSNESITESLRDKYLTFLVDQDQYGVEIKHVTEIIGIQLITEMPQMPDYIRGVINLRGRIIPVMDVRIRFGKPIHEYNDRTCIIVLELHELSIGLIVDRVSEVMSIMPEQIVPPPELGDARNRFVSGLGKVGSDVMLLLDCSKLLWKHEPETDSPTIKQNGGIDDEMAL